MRHTATAAAVTSVLLLTLTACGSGSSDGKPAASSPSPSTTSSTNGQGAFLKAAHQIAFTGSSPTDDELAAYPPKWCAGLDSGHSVAWLFSDQDGGLYPIGQDWGMVKADAYQLLVAGVKAYCPDHVDAVTQELRASGDY